MRVTAARLCRGGDAINSVNLRKFTKTRGFHSFVNIRVVFFRKNEFEVRIIQFNAILQKVNGELKKLYETTL